MAKKVKRKVSQVSSSAATQKVMEVRSVESSTASTAVATPRTTTGRRNVSTVQEFNPDYSYVVKDLKRIGMLAGTFFVILVILSFIIR
jgi:hypothetical protein